MDAEKLLKCKENLMLWQLQSSGVKGRDLPLTDEDWDNAEEEVWVSGTHCRLEFFVLENICDDARELN